MDFGENVLQRSLLAFGESVSGVAVGAAEVAGGEPDENAGQPGKGAFTLQAQIYFIDDQRLGHGCNLAAEAVMNNAQ
jgi:hypothetical protein